MRFMLRCPNISIISSESVEPLGFGFVRKHPVPNPGVQHGVTLTLETVQSGIPLDVITHPNTNCLVGSTVDKYRKPRKVAFVRVIEITLTLRKKVGQHQRQATGWTGARSIRNSG